MTGSESGARLAEVATLDPFALEPGVLIGERFCVLGAVSHRERGWTVPVTDLARELGRPPTHRAVVEHVSLMPAQRASWRRALTVELAQPHVYAMVETPQGVELVTADPGSRGLPRPLDLEGFVGVALALGCTLAALHERAVVGVSFDVDALRLVDGGVVLAGHGHLELDGERRGDLDRLVGLLATLDPQAVRELVPGRLERADELVGRAQAVLAELTGRPVVTTGRLGAETPTSLPMRAPARTVLDGARLRAMVDRARARPGMRLDTGELHVRVDGSLEVDCSPAALEDILAQLLKTGADALPGAARMWVTAARELVGQVRAAGLPGAAAGAYCVVRVLVPSSRPIARLLSGLDQGREVVARAGGFLTVEQNARLGLVLAAHLPSEPSEAGSAAPPRGRVAVVHHDDRVRRTVVASLARLGYDCLDVSSPGLLGELGEHALVFADASSVAGLAHRGQVMIEVVQRGQPPGTVLPLLRVPFAVEELDALLASLDRADPAPRT